MFPSNFARGDLTAFQFDILDLLRNVLDAEDFEPTVVPVVLTKGSKWEGEDEEEDIKVGNKIIFYFWNA